MEYNKINTLFKRNEKNIIIPTEYTCEEFMVLENSQWECTEKIDGTNIRIELVNDNGIINMTFNGKSENSIIPPHLVKKMNELFSKVDWIDIFSSDFETITIYGEGYGKNIQHGGNYIKDDVSFILFDVKIGKWWLKRESLENIAKKLNIDIVPIIGYFTIPEAIELVKKGFKSVIAENKDYDAEGLVLKTPLGLMKRDGERIITKIKSIDFIRYNRSLNKK